MDKVTASVVMGAITGFLLSVGPREVSTRPVGFPAPIIFGFIAFFTSIWGIDRGHSISGVLILTFCPLGSGWAGHLLSQWLMPHVEGRWRTALLLSLSVVFLAVFLVGFPPEPDELAQGY